MDFPMQTQKLVEEFHDVAHLSTGDLLQEHAKVCRMSEWLHCMKYAWSHFQMAQLRALFEVVGFTVGDAQKVSTD